MKDFISLGEILIDLAPAQPGSQAYIPNPGGAPANVACVLGILGDNAAFAGKVGDDVFGKLCVKALESCGVDTTYIAVTDRHPTTLAVVGLDETGDRSFGFYRGNTADVTMTEAEIADIPFGDYRVFHFGSVSLSAEPLRSATFAAVKKAKEQGCLISYDPNLRAFLWEDMDEAREMLRKGIPYADILKISEEEAEFLFGATSDAEVLSHLKDVPLVLLTKADRGCVCAFQGALYESAAFKVDVVDTTGAGDAFFGGLLHCLLQTDGDLKGHILAEELPHILDFANATGSLVTRAKGAIPAIPSLAEIEQSLAANIRIILE